MRDLLPELVNQILSLMSGGEPEQQEVTNATYLSRVVNFFQTAGRTITELCRKFGERVFGEIVVILKKSMSLDAHVREGVCLTICEMMYVTNRYIMSAAIHPGI